jgi:hypothetical protein
LLLILGDKYMKKPKTWTEAYPHGTKEGNDELLFWNALARNKKYDWRSISALGKDTGLSEVKIEKLIAKYHKKGMVFQNPENAKYWGYWELHQDLLPKEDKSIIDADHKGRIDDALGVECLGDDFDEPVCCKPASNTGCTTSTVSCGTINPLLGFSLTAQNPFTFSENVYFTPNNAGTLFFAEITYQEN